MPLIEIGSPAPDFTLPDQHNEKHTLSKQFAGRIVVLYFYPKDDTSGCTTQACDFRDHHPDFTGVQATILGVSPDPTDSHAKFAEKHRLNFTLLADVPDASGTPRVCDAYGVWDEKSMYGRKYMGVVRTTYLIDQKGKVAARWDNVKVPGHAGEVLAAVKKLHAGEMLEVQGHQVGDQPKAGKLKLSKGDKAGAQLGKKAHTKLSFPAYTPVRGPAPRPSSRVIKGGGGRSGGKGGGRGR